MESDNIDENETFEFDFFEEEEEEEEDNSDIIDDSALLATDDPVVSAVGQILSACGRLKASDSDRTSAPSSPPAPQGPVRNRKSR